MAWYSGQATDYQDFLDLLDEFATSIGIQTVAVNAGGTGYTEGDTVTVSGGTSTTACTVEVAAVSGGVVTQVYVINAGAYSVAPGLTGAATTGGTGSGLTLDLTTQAAGWTRLRKESQRFVVRIETLTNAGSGYVVDDILTLDSSGDAETTPVTEATFRVNSVDGGGAITSISVETRGEYTENSSGSDFPLTGGTGSGARLDPFFTGTAGEDELILEGSGSGSDQIFVGVRTYTVSGIGAKNWELTGFTGYTPENTFTEQPGKSPAVYDDQSPIDGGAYLLLRDVAFNYWMSITSSRIIIFVATGSNYHSAYLGFLDRFSTDAQYPYPLVILGSCSEPERQATSSDVGMGGFPDPVADSEFEDYGPGMIRWIDGVWRNIRNAYKNGSALSVDTSGGINGIFNIWPRQTTAGSVSLDSEDNWAQTSPAVYFEGQLCERAIGQTPTQRLEPTPNTGGALSPMFPLTVISSEFVSIVGQFPGLWWVSASRDGDSGATSEDTFTLANGRRFRMFQNVGRSEIYDFVAIEEA